MAVNDPNIHSELFLAPRVRMAAATAGVLALLGVAGAITAAVALPSFSPLLVASAVVLCLAMGLTAYEMSRGHQGAFYFELVLFLLIAVAALTCLILLAMGGSPRWWSQSIHWHMAWLVGPILGASLLQTALLTVSVPANSRLRFGTYSSISMAAAVLVVVLVNVIAHRDYFHHNFESLGYYGVSDSTSKVLADLNTDVSLTCVYTGQGDRSREYRQRTMDLLKEMHERNPRVSVHEAATDAEKAAVLARLRRQGGSGAAATHHALLQELSGPGGKELTQLMRQQHQQWSAVDEESYLGQWAQAAMLAPILERHLQVIEELLGKIRGKLSVGIPDYAALSTEVKSTLASLEEQLAAEQQFLAKLQAVPASARSVGPEAKASAKQCDKLAGELLELSRKKDDPKTTIAQYNDKARKLAEQCRLTSQKIDALAGKGNSEMLLGYSGFGMPTQTGTSISLSSVYQRWGTAITQILEEAADLNEPRMLEAFAGFAQQQKDFLSAAAKYVDASVDGLTQVDAPSLELISSGASQDNAFGGLLTNVQDLLKRAIALPELKSQSLSDEISGENIVLLEVSGKDPEVISFEEAWPVLAPGGAARQAEPRRVFNGDSAIASRILRLTRKPFATVLMTYASLPPQMATRVPPEYQAGPEQFAALRKRLEAANFAVQDWDVNQEMPAALKDSLASASQPATAATDEPPVVLLVLPPSPLMPLAREQLDKITKLLDSPAKAVPAVFLQGHSPQPPMMAMMAPPPSVLKDYLRDTWGVEARSDYRLVAGVSDETMVGRYRLDLVKLSYLPLNAFSDHPIAAPLRGQRVFWVNVCPVEKAADAPDNVDVATLLTADADAGPLWATRNMEQVIDAVRNEQSISPDPNSGDLLPPVSVAVSAVRQPKGKNAPGGRIVVLGVGSSLVDGYLDAQVPQIGDKNSISFDAPPRTNADLVINSVYWLSGQDRYIARGPTTIKPIVVDEASRKSLEAAFTLALPLAIGLLGGIVMYLRRR